MKKKITLVLASFMVICMMVACNKTTTNENTESYNGITKTEITTTTNGQTTVEVVYTDADGNEMDEEEGKAAFESAKAAVEGGETEAETESATVAETEAAEIIEATLAIANETGVDLVEFYFVPADVEEWGENLLEEAIEDGYVSTWENGFHYTADSAWDMMAVTADGNELSWEGLTFDETADPSNIEIVITIKEDGTPHIEY